MSSSGSLVSSLSSVGHAEPGWTAGREGDLEVSPDEDLTEVRNDTPEGSEFGLMVPSFEESMANPRPLANAILDLS